MDTLLVMNQSEGQFRTEDERTNVDEGISSGADGNGSRNSGGNGDTTAEGAQRSGPGHNIGTLEAAEESDRNEDGSDSGSVIDVDCDGGGEKNSLDEQDVGVLL